MYEFIRKLFYQLKTLEYSENLRPDLSENPFF